MFVESRWHRVATVCSIAISVCFIAGCEYRGDGEYKAHDIWPLEWFELTLPAFELQEGLHKRFTIDGYRSHGTSYLKLVITNPESIDFSKIDAELDVKIMDTIATSFFHRTGPLNKHLLRARELKENVEPNPDEWDCHYLYAADYINRQARAFSLEVPIVETPTLTCYHFMPSGKTEYQVIINVGHVPPELAGATAQIRLHSSWK